MREDVHRFANVSEVQAVYDVLERPRNVNSIMSRTNQTYSQVRSAVKVLEYKGRVVGIGPEPNRRYQWRR